MRFGKRSGLHRESAPKKGRVPRELSYETAYLHCVGRRERQEDSYTYVNDDDVSLMKSQGLLAVVADGMGGMYGGREASTAAIDIMKQDFASFDYDGDIAQQLAQSVHHANSVVRNMLNGAGGSTLIACLLYQQQLYYAGVGDSFFYLARDGKLIRLNREQNTKHRLYTEAIDRGVLDPAEANSDPGRAAVTQYLGMEALTDLDSFKRPLPLKSNDVLLLCSDGVVGGMEENTILDCLNRENAVATCAMLDQIIVGMDNPYQDNYTALVIRCEK